MNESINLQMPLHLREWEHQGPTAEALARISLEVPEEDFFLFRRTAILAEQTGLPEEERANVLGLLNDFYQAGPEDAQFARGSMDALPIMLSAADVLEDVTGVEIDRGVVWQGVLHDIGKEYVEEETKHKSNIGAKDYDDNDMAKMERHILYGLIKATIGGAPEAGLLGAEHHARQPRNPYTVGAELTPGQELAVICVAIGDHLGAAKTRRNNRTEGVKLSAIWSRARGAVEHTLRSFPDFEADSKLLTERVMEAGWSRSELQAALFDKEVSYIGKRALASTSQSLAA